MTAVALTGVAGAAWFGRARRGEHYSGDLAFIHEDGANIFLAMVDVAEHGRPAHRVAVGIESILRSENTDDLIALAQSLHHRLIGGLGAVMIAGNLDSESLKFDFVQVGDSHGKIFGPQPRTLVGQAGMLGHDCRTPIVRAEALPADDILVLCSDGISERYDLSDITVYWRLSTDALAREIVERFGKNHDDASCLVVRCG